MHKVFAKGRKMGVNVEGSEEIGEYMRLAMRERREANRRRASS